MNDIIEGVKALDFNPDLVTENVSVENSRAVKVSALFVDKITSLYAKRAAEFKPTPKEEKVVKKPVVEEEYEKPVYEAPVYGSYDEEEESPAFEAAHAKLEAEEEKEEAPKYEEPVYEAPVVETPKVEVKHVVHEAPKVEATEQAKIADPDGMLSDIASSFEMAVAQIHAKQKEIDLKEKEVDEIRAHLIAKEDKTTKLLDELERMKKEVEAAKKEADKIIRNAEVEERELQKRIDAFEQERQKFLNNLKMTSSSIMNLVDGK